MDEHDRWAYNRAAEEYNTGLAKKVVDPKEREMWVTLFAACLGGVAATHPSYADRPLVILQASQLADEALVEIKRRHAIFDAAQLAQAKANAEAMNKARSDRR